MQHSARDEMRKCQRPPFRNREYARREKRIEQPVAKLEQKFAKCRRFPTLQTRLGDAIDDGENGWANPGSRDNHPWAQAWHSHVATVSLVHCQPQYRSRQPRHRSRITSLTQPQKGK